MFKPEEIRNFIQGNSVFCLVASQYNFRRISESEEGEEGSLQT